MQFQQSQSIQRVLARRRAPMRTFLSSSPGGMLYERVVLYLPKSSVHIFKRGAVCLPPPLHNIMCFLFCVCFDPSLAANLCCGKAQARVALLCYFWQQQRLVAAEGERRQKGDIMKLKTRGCLRDFCLEELFFNHQSLSLSVCVSVRVHIDGAPTYIHSFCEVWPLFGDAGPAALS